MKGKNPSSPDLQSLTELDDRLRARAADPVAVHEALARARAALAAARRDGHRRKEARLLGYAGTRSACSARPPRAAALAESHRLAQRLGDQRAGERAGGARLRAPAPRTTVLDLGRTEAARDCSRKALELRRRKDDAALVASTEAALQHLAATE